MQDLAPHISMVQPCPDAHEVVLVPEEAAAWIRTAWWPFRKYLNLSFESDFLFDPIRLFRFDSISIWHPAVAVRLRYC